MTWLQKNNGKKPIRTTLTGRTESEIETRKMDLLSKGWKVIRSGVAEKQDTMEVEVRKRTTRRVGKSTNIVHMSIPIKSYWCVMESPIRKVAEVTKKAQ